jgi:ribonuclease BN (tRNA processing enzyme)
VKHEEQQEAYGYLVTDESESATVGFTGDSAYCASVEQMARHSDLLFADMSFESGSETHMGVNNIVELMERRAGDAHSAVIVPTHMSDESRALFKALGHGPPTDGQIFETPRKENRNDKQI